MVSERLDRIETWIETPLVPDLAFCMHVMLSNEREILRVEVVSQEGR
jgi:hypothetical protein